MDALSAFLDGPRARGAFLIRSVMEPPWGLHIEDEAPLAVMAVVQGQAWIWPDGTPASEAIPLGPGDIAIARGPHHYSIADLPSTVPEIRILPGQECSTLDGVSVVDSMALGVRTWGNAPDGATVLVTGVYQLAGEVSRGLLDALPPLIVLPATEMDCPLIGVLAGEVGRDEPGQEAVLDRLLDLVLIDALRSWFARPESEAPSWYRAQRDPIIGQAIRLLQRDPARAWTVGTLANEVGLSRAALARRFADLVGEPPMRFLTSWRLTLAADLLREPGATLTSVAREVGYGSPFALSVAFKRDRGVTPYQHRLQATA